jgi:glyoxylase-like metal-dependent hydrolase (beta-lactamase superfamily II)
MLFRQLFDSVSGTYTYLLASRRGGEALIIDPVIEKVERYLQLVNELDLKLVKAVDTHLHADHITGLGALRDRTHCITVMGEMSKVDVVSMRLAEGDKLTIEGVALDVLYTPGHTDDSYSFRMNDRVFTGDTLLIRGTGRTDFQNGLRLRRTLGDGGAGGAGRRHRGRLPYPGRYRCLEEGGRAAGALRGVNPDTLPPRARCRGTPGIGPPYRRER